MNIFKKTSNLLIIVFTTIVLFYVINYLCLSKYFKEIPGTMCAANFNAVMEYFSGNINLSDFIMKSWHLDYPPLYFLNLLLALSIFGRDWVLMIIMVNTFYLIMILAFTYLLGKELVDEKTGLTAAILVSLYPATWVTYRWISMEFSLIGITAMSVFFLHRSKYFSSFKWSMLFSLSCIWGMWIKDVFGAFIIGPIVYVFYNSLKTSRNDRDIKPVLNFLAFAITFYISIHPYYFKGLLELNYWTLLRPFDEITGYSWYSFENIKPFLYSYWEAQLGLFFFIVFIAGIFYFIRSMKFKPKEDALVSSVMDLKIMLLLWIIVPTLMVLLMPHNKTARYLIQEASAIAIISAFLVRRLLDKKLGMLIFLMLVSFGVFRYYRITYYDTSMDDFVCNTYLAKGIYETTNAARSYITEDIEKMKKLGKGKTRFVCTMIINPRYFKIDLKTVLWFNNMDDITFHYYPFDFNLDIPKLNADEKLIKKNIEIINNSDFIIFVHEDKQSLGLDVFKAMMNIHSYDPETYKMFGWEKYEGIFEDEMAKFKNLKNMSDMPWITKGLSICARK